MLPFCGRSGGQHSEKIKGNARGNWDPREGQQPFRSNPNGVGDRTTTLRRLLIGAETVNSIEKLCDKVETVNGFCYLGDRLNSSGGCEAQLQQKNRWGKIQTKRRVIASK